MADWIRAVTELVISLDWRPGGPGLGRSLSEFHSCAFVHLRLAANKIYKYIITKQHTVRLWSISPSEQLTRDQKELFLLSRSYDALRRNS